MTYLNGYILYEWYIVARDGNYRGSQLKFQGLCTRTMSKTVREKPLTRLNVRHQNTGRYRVWVSAVRLCLSAHHACLLGHSTIQAITSVRFLKPCDFCSFLRHSQPVVDACASNMSRVLTFTRLCGTAFNPHTQLHFFHRNLWRYI